MTRKNYLREITKKPPIPSKEIWRTPKEKGLLGEAEGQNNNKGVNAPANKAQQAQARTTNDEDFDYLVDVQGNILQPHGRKNVRLVSLGFRTDRTSIAEALRDHVAHRVNRALLEFRHTEAIETPFLSFFLARAGMDYLGLVQDKFDYDVPDINDYGEPAANFHALLLLADNNPTRLEETSAALESDLGESMHVEPLRVALHAKNFGFRDPVSQPELVVRDGTPDRNKANLYWVFMRYSLSDKDDDEESYKLGSILAYREFTLNTDRFAEWVRDTAMKKKVPPEEARSWVLGRKHGRPLTGAGTEDFDYSGDEDGTSCPKNTHIRLMNPRGPLDENKISRQEPPPRIVRRSIKYENGLHFMAYNADCEEQFDKLFYAWGQNPKSEIAPHDPFFGKGQDNLGPGADGVKRPTEPFATVKAGAYFLVPAVSTLFELPDLVKG